MQKKQRNTIPKQIKSAWESGKRDAKGKALDLAIYNRMESDLTDLARELYWLLKLETNQETMNLALAASGGGERHGWQPPRRQSAKERRQSFES